MLDAVSIFPVLSQCGKAYLETTALKQHFLNPHPSGNSNLVYFSFNIFAFAHLPPPWNFH